MSIQTVCYIVSTLERTGPIAQLLNLVRYLDRREFRPLIVTLSPEKPNSTSDAFALANVDRINLGLGRVSGAFLGSRRLTRILSQEGMPAVIHSNGFRADIVSNQLDLPAPRIATLRNYPQLDYARTYGRALGAWMARRHVTALRKKDMVVCVSAAVEENIHTYGVRSTTVIRNGVDTESFTPASAAEKAELRDRLGMPRDAFIWTVSGVLTARKNPEFILDGFARTFAGDPLHQLVFVGGGDLEASLRKRAAGNGNIRVVGPVTSVAAYLRMSDVNIAASSAEGLPNSVLEALACGLPALLSDIGPHREIAALAPASVTLFPLESTEGFAAGARKVVQSLGSPTLPVPHSRLPQELTAPVMSQSYADLYRRTIAASR